MMIEMLVSALLTALPVPDDADDLSAEPDEATAPSDDFTEIPAVARDYECVVDDENGASFTWDEGEVKIYCLAYCEGFDEYRRAWQSPVDPVDKPEGWCLNKAKKYCHRYNLDFEDSCYGERD
ncbi:hypothetical protein [Nannocystis sp. SCPEA4]|uniref:hypothetical protein n=1 Tax=Nannocystis sp. SCPEA4 TaxID=2996787 RepID=UPI00226E7A0C|nr:hypothetical protein [Nannocystis sp. SCPEA4]MCY1053942.1 hypothetical protein [Nannocystis sp. SCPEA4]